MRSTLIFGMALSAAVVAAPAFANTALAAPDQALGTAIMSAYVEATGDLVHGAGVVTSAYLAAVNMPCSSTVRSRTV